MNDLRARYRAAVTECQAHKFGDLRQPRNFPMTLGRLPSVKGCIPELMAASGHVPVAAPAIAHEFRPTARAFVLVSNDGLEAFRVIMSKSGTALVMACTA